MVLSPEQIPLPHLPQRLTGFQDNPGLNQLLEKFAKDVAERQRGESDPEFNQWVPRPAEYLFTSKASDDLEKNRRPLTSYEQKKIPIVIEQMNKFLSENTTVLSSFESAIFSENGQLEENIQIDDVIEAKAKVIVARHCQLIAQTIELMHFIGSQSGPIYRSLEKKLNPEERNALQVLALSLEVLADNDQDVVESLALINKYWTPDLSLKLQQIIL